MSDVSASLFTLGRPIDVENYCKKLIDKLGVDGGHILGSGCEVPYNCKPENFRAMIETGKNYELSKS
jgi:uroporphyrinogen-III decarboxylase